MFSSLKVKNFRVYWFGMFISLIGTWIQTVAQSWLVFQLTNSAFLLGVVGFLSSIPVFLLSLFGGVLADRLNKRDILIATQSAFMLLAFLLAALTQMKLITPYQIMFVALLNGVVMAFDAPARQAMVVELVGKDYLFNAIALNSIAFNSSRIIGPALAGVLVATIGMSGCFYINGISFLPLIIALFFIRVNPVRDKAPKATDGCLRQPISNGVNKYTASDKKIAFGDNSKVRFSVVRKVFYAFLYHKNNTAWRDLKEALIFIRNNRLILVLITMTGVVSLFGIAYVIFMPIFANDILKVGVQGLAVLMSSAGLGALIAALLLARLGDFKYKGKLLVLASFIFSFSLVLFSLSKIYLLSLIALIFIGGSSVTAIALINTILQTKVPNEFMGRVMGVYMLTFFGILPFGNLIAGSLAEALGISFTIMLSGIICGSFFAIINIIYPEIRNV